MLKGGRSSSKALQNNKSYIPSETQNKPKVNLFDIFTGKVSLQDKTNIIGSTEVAEN
jgi:hypothetical protein